MVSRFSLVFCIASVLSAPWAATVLIASSDSTTFFNEASSLRNRVVSSMGTAQSGRLLLGAAHHRHHAQEPSFLNGFNPFASPNTATTTVHPTTLPPPATEEQSAMLVTA